MTAKGKINASNVTAGDRIIVQVREDGTVRESSTKTGEGVQIARVLDKTFRAAGQYEARGKYIVHTTAGQFEAAPIQTMWLAPEDAAGIKRAHVEALEENKRQDRAATPAEVEAPAQAEVMRQAAELARTAPTAEAAAEIMAEATGLTTEALAGWVAANWTGTGPTPAELVAAMDEAHEPTTAECENEWHRTAPARARLLCPECPTPAAPVVARPTLSPALRLQMVGRVLRTPELTFDLPPVATSRELVRLSDIAPSSLLTLHSHAGNVVHMNNDASTQTETTPAQPTEAQAAEAQKHTGSTVVALIERVWDRIRADHPELPAVVVTTGSGEGVKWGHFRPESWKLAEKEGRLHEFFLASEALAKGAAQVLQTTIHEAAHTLSKVRGKKDTSRQGRWHNAEFRSAAEELGLEHKGKTAHKSHGFSFVTLTEATKEKYADLLAELDSELKLTGLLPFWMGGQDEQDEQGGEKITGKPKKGEGEEGEGAAKSGNLKATCQCSEPVIIRLSRKVLDLGVVRCDGCSELFTAA
jgi:hypothetical protein